MSFISRIAPHFFLPFEASTVVERGRRLGSGSSSLRRIGAVLDAVAKTATGRLADGLFCTRLCTE